MDSKDESAPGGRASDAWVEGPFESVYTVRDKRMLVLASYCGGENPNCSDERPCNLCLADCNVALVRGQIKVLGGLDYIQSLPSAPSSQTEASQQPQDEQENPIAQRGAS